MIAKAFQRVGYWNHKVAAGIFDHTFDNALFVGAGHPAKVFFEQIVALQF